jgi:hypothetical protein
MEALPRLSALPGWSLVTSRILGGVKWRIVLSSIVAWCVALRFSIFFGDYLWRRTLQILKSERSNRLVGAKKKGQLVSPLFYLTSRQIKLLQQSFAPKPPANSLQKAAQLARTSASIRPNLRESFQLSCCEFDRAASQSTPSTAPHQRP